jgi:acyl transferase domain-containing protein
VIGCNALLSTDATTQLANMGFLSPDSKCHSFDARANGFGRGEGVVALVVKPLARALADGDMIRAVLRATASNQDGRTPTWTQPSASAQETLIRHVYAKAGLALDDTRYFEAHGV